MFNPTERVLSVHGDYAISYRNDQLGFWLVIANLELMPLRLNQRKNWHIGGKGSADLAQLDHSNMARLTAGYRISGENAETLPVKHLDAAVAFSEASLPLTVDVISGASDIRNLENVKFRYKKAVSVWHIEPHSYS
jgi:hypothetical protein